MAKQRTFTIEEIEEAMECGLGFCTSCGAMKGFCEPDARNYECDDCGEMAVYGAEELVVMGLVA